MFNGACEKSHVSDLPIPTREELQRMDEDDQAKIRALAWLSDQEFMFEVRRVRTHHEDRLWQRTDWHFTVEQEFKFRAGENELQRQFLRASVPR